VSVFGICRDVTAERETQAMLRSAKDAAERANRIKSEFLANMSHELRTPLNAVIGFSDMLRREMLGPLSPKYREYADDINKSGQHLLDLINDLLDTARIEAGKMEMHDEPVRMDSLVNEALRLCRPVSLDVKHRFELHIPSPAPVLLADHRCLKQVLVNLIGNAVKFTPDGGRITVTIGVGEDAVSVAVADTGIGIPRERIDDLGTPFSQIEAGMSRRHGGSGMGLFISKAFVEKHGGSMAISSDGPGCGTTVTVTLPASRLLAGGAG
jgi:two-component system cell cycle sensor histidine kinase PleC